METFRFDAVIVRSDERGASAFVHFPYDLLSTFGSKSQVKVACAFDGVPCRGSFVDMGTGPVIGYPEVDTGSYRQTGRGYSPRLSLEG